MLIDESRLRGRGHLFAGSSAPAARFRAVSAMFHTHFSVFFAFFGTGVANLGA